MNERGAIEYCESCGTVDDRKTDIARQLAEKDALTSHLTQELIRLRAQITRLTNDDEEQRRRSPHAKDAREVFEHWRANVMPRAREFSGKRFDTVVARLKAGHTVEDLKRAVDGCALRPYVNDRGRSASGSPDQWQADLELICRTEAHVARFAGIVEAEALLRAATAQSVIEASRAGATAGAARAGAPLTNLPNTVRSRELATYREAMTADVAGRLAELRGWTPEVVERLGLGLRSSRVVFPAENAAGELVGLHAFAPNPEKRTGPKMLADGSRELFPRPEVYTGGTCWLVEGEPDAVAAISAGLQAVGVPGVGTWKAGWAHRFERFDRVIVTFDCDQAGRDAALARARLLATAGIQVKVLDLNADRVDGYDVGDVVQEMGHEDAGRALWALADDVATVTPLRMPTPQSRQTRHSGRPLDVVREALGNRGLRINGSSAQCPAHDDRHASLSLGEGRDGRALLSCHAGCEPQRIVDALGLSWSDLFEEATG